MNAAEPIRNGKLVKKLLNYYKNLGQTRNFLLIALCLYTGLRISDILSLKTDDVYDFDKKAVKYSIAVREKKTGKIKTIAIHAFVKMIIKKYAPRLGAKCALLPNPQTGKAISRVHAYRIIQAAGKNAGIDTKVGCHSLRKTFGYFAWKNGTPPALIMELFNHSSWSVTRRYLGITQDDINKAYLELTFDIA